MRSALQDIEEYLKLRDRVEWGLSVGIRALSREVAVACPHHPLVRDAVTTQTGPDCDKITTPRSPNNT